MDYLKNGVLQSDLEYIFKKFNEREKLDGSTFLISGCAGFLGFYFMHFLVRYAEELNVKKIIGLDSFILERPVWLDLLEKTSDRVLVKSFDIISDDIANVEGLEEADYIVHMASIASPSYYRKFPLNTLDANIWGLRRLLDYYAEKPIRRLLFFSSSEIYGDPAPGAIPTPEDYSGNVACIGPRACYGEAKRFGETMCYVFNKQCDMPISIVRPFNNFGPGMRLKDKRAPADFALAVYERRDIEIFSDGTPTRTFCYVADAITGYFKVLTYDEWGAFNIGIEKPEIMILELAEIYVEVGREIFGYSGQVKLSPPPDSEYLTDNPSRRCPVIDRARTLLGYDPKIEVREGVERFLRFIKECEGRA